MKKLVGIVMLSLVCSPAFAQERIDVDKIQAFLKKTGNNIQMACSKEMMDCSKKLQELVSQQKDASEQVKICQDLGQQAGVCAQERLKEFYDDVDKLDVNSADFDKDFEQLVKKWDKEAGKEDEETSAAAPPGDLAPAEPK